MAHTILSFVWVVGLVHLISGAKIPPRVDSVATIAAIAFTDAINKLLLGKLVELAVLSPDAILHGSLRREGPAAATRALVLDGAHTVFLTPVDALIVGLTQLGIFDFLINVRLVGEEGLVLLLGPVRELVVTE